ncbi:hypothetical protein DFH09DRAFT_1289709 [Mycena vulgaris]|nr:hypothetical protein DFH09DRAFT_1289709 [Mycena vulgaris]
MPSPPTDGATPSSIVDAFFPACCRPHSRRRTAADGGRRRALTHSEAGGERGFVSSPSLHAAVLTPAFLGADAENDGDAPGLDYPPSTPTPPCVPRGEGGTTRWTAGVKVKQAKAMSQWRRRRVGNDDATLGWVDDGWDAENEEHAAYSEPSARDLLDGADISFVILGYGYARLDLRAPMRSFPLQTATTLIRRRCEGPRRRHANPCASPVHGCAPALTHSFADRDRDYTDAGIGGMDGSADRRARRIRRGNERARAAGVGFLSLLQPAPPRCAVELPDGRDPLNGAVLMLLRGDWTGAVLAWNATGVMRGAEQARQAAGAEGVLLRPRPLDHDRGSDEADTRRGARSVDTSVRYAFTRTPALTRFCLSAYLDLDFVRDLLDLDSGSLGRAGAQAGAPTSPSEMWCSGWGEEGGSRRSARHRYLTLPLSQSRSCNDARSPEDGRRAGRKTREGEAQDVRAGIKRAREGAKAGGGGGNPDIDVHASRECGVHGGAGRREGRVQREEWASGREEEWDFEEHEGGDVKLCRVERVRAREERGLGLIDEGEWSRSTSSWAQIKNN